MPGSSPMGFPFEGFDGLVEGFELSGVSLGKVLGVVVGCGVVVVVAGGVAVCGWIISLPLGTVGCSLPVGGVGSGIVDGAGCGVGFVARCFFLADFTGVAV